MHFFYSLLIIENTKPFLLIILLTHSFIYYPFLIIENTNPFYSLFYSLTHLFIIHS